MKIFPRFQLPCICLPSLFIGSFANLSNNKLLNLKTTLGSQKHWMKVYKLSFCHIEIIKAKYVLWCLDKQWYDFFPIYLIACNIPTVFSIIEWHFMRVHHLVQIDREYVIFLIGCNLHFTKFVKRHVYYTFLNSSYDIFASTLHNFSTSLFLILWHTLTPPSQWMPSNGH